MKYDRTLLALFVTICLLFPSTMTVYSHPVTDTPLANSLETRAQSASPLQNDTNSPYTVFFPAIYGRRLAFYVSPSGNDANPGSYDKPWRTLQKAADTLVAGETVHILPGSYQAKFAPKNSGTAEAYITYTATPGTVTLDGTGVALNDLARGDGLVQIAGKSYIRIQNLTLRNSAHNCVNISEDSSGNRPKNIEVTGLDIKNCMKAGIRARFTTGLVVKDNVIDHISYSSGIGVWWSDRVTVDNNKITNAHYYHSCQGAHEEALTIASTSNFVVKNNTLDNTEPPPPGACAVADKLGIDVKESSQYGQVFQNTISNMNAASIYTDPWHAGANGTPTLKHIQIYQNKIVNSAGIIIGAEQADGVSEHISIFNNVLINPTFAGIQVRKSYGDGLRKNIVIYNNTIYGASPAGGNGGAGIYITTANLASNNTDAPVIVRNNIVMFYFLNSGGGTVGQIYAANAGIASKVTADHNLVYGPQYCSWDYPNCVELGSRLRADPASVFVDPGAFDLHLKSGSPAINAGYTVQAVATDFDGVRRPQPDGHSYDIGAYEWR